jgi:5-methylcytosine-specific restriction endonuclease McrBC GTP-binding regulatory subunit McrB
MTDYKQLILFGSPGTGKSYMVRSELLPALDVDPNGDNCIQTVFHPEYSYGDFMGKLMPLSRDGNVEYNYYEGHFLKALARAYSNILASENSNPDHVALIIDEINRGNSASIFGTAFQLLDRERDGWSEYAAEVSDMEFRRLMEMIGIRVTGSDEVKGRDVPVYRYQDQKKRYLGDELNEFLKPLKIRRNQIRIPGNLSLIATMNTSDHSIYHMDTAFKRRWSWQYVDVDSTLKNESGNAFEDREEWSQFVNRLNDFIRDNSDHVRKVEDRLVGHWYIDAEGRPITYAEIQNKVMFFLWDSVFETSREPLSDILDLNHRLHTFGEFAEHVQLFVRRINQRYS